MNWSWVYPTSGHTGDHEASESGLVGCPVLRECRRNIAISNSWTDDSLVQFKNVFLRSSHINSDSYDLERYVIYCLSFILMIIHSFIDELYPIFSLDTLGCRETPYWAISAHSFLWLLPGDLGIRNGRDDDSWSLELATSNNWS